MRLTGGRLGKVPKVALLATSSLPPKGLVCTGPGSGGGGALRDPLSLYQEACELVELCSGECIGVEMVTNAS